MASACSMWARDSVGMVMLSDGYMIYIDVIITYGRPTRHPEAASSHTDHAETLGRRVMMVMRRWIVRGDPVVRASDRAPEIGQWTIQRGAQLCAPK